MNSLSYLCRSVAILIMLSLVTSCHTGRTTHKFGRTSYSRSKIIKRLEAGETLEWRTPLHGLWPDTRIQICGDTLSMHTDSWIVTPFTQSSDIPHQRIKATTIFTVQRQQKYWWRLYPAADGNEMLFGNSSVEQLKNIDLDCDSTVCFRFMFPNLDSYVRIIVETDCGPVVSDFSNQKEQTIATRLKPQRIESIAIEPYDYTGLIISDSPSSTRLWFKADIDMTIEGAPIFTFPNVTSANLYQISIAGSMMYLNGQGCLDWLNYRYEFNDF